MLGATIAHLRTFLFLVLWASPVMGQSLVPLDHDLPPLMAEVDPLFGGSVSLVSTQVMPLGHRRPPERADEGRRCGPDGRLCIGTQNYAADVCRAIQSAAREAGLDPHFFARLLWRESRFDPNAVSHAGAQGIAQFMPGTAHERGLADPFNPAEALPASARLLVDLRKQFGNLGLAAAAYNAGPGRVEKFLSGARRLPGETRAYVAAITGHSGTAWRDGRPAPDYRLDGPTPFLTACEAKAAGRSFTAPMPKASAPPMVSKGPWSVVVASHKRPEVALRRAKRMARKLPDDVRAAVPALQVTHPLDETEARAAFPTANAQTAKALCQRLRASGATCEIRQGAEISE